MSCWVVPTVAAEFWGISVQNILEKIKAGHVPSKVESGFTFVDVAPLSPIFRPRSQAKANPPTFTVVTREELVALTGETEIEDDNDEVANELGDWRGTRRDTQKLRRAPNCQLSVD